MVPPARESDRCRIAEYFSRLVKKAPAELAWTRAFVAADHVQRAVIAAEQGLKVINLSFTTDLPLLTLPLAQAGAGIAAWGGMIDVGLFGGINQRYPLFYAIQQLGRNLSGYTSIRRLPYDDPRVRVYAVTRARQEHFVGWLEPGTALLPGDPVPRRTVPLVIGRTQAILEPVVTVLGQTAPEMRPVAAPGGTLALELTPTPVFVH